MKAVEARMLGFLFYALLVSTFSAFPRRPMLVASNCSSRLRDGWTSTIRMMERGKDNRNNCGGSSYTVRSKMISSCFVARAAPSEALSASS